MTGRLFTNHLVRGGILLSDAHLNRYRAAILYLRFSNSHTPDYYYTSAEMLVQGPTPPTPPPRPQLHSLTNRAALIFDVSES